MSEFRRCELCGREAHDIRTRIVAWIPSVVGQGVKPFDHVDRCSDYQACRGRLEAKGESWPVRDSVTRPTTKQSPDHEEVPV